MIQDLTSQGLHKYAHLMLNLSLALLLSASLLAEAKDTKSLLESAKSYLQSGNNIEALAVSQDAVRANPKDYKGFYYLSLAYMSLGKFDQANENADKALSLAPASAKPAIEKLKATIQSNKGGSASLAAAEAAEADGLNAKAAKLYDEAWSATQTKPLLGLKAAGLYKNKLDQPLDAARIYRQVLKTNDANTGYASDATAALKEMQPKLNALAESYAKQAQTTEVAGQALDLLQKAEIANPDYVKIYELRFDLASSGSDLLAFKNAIKALSTKKALKIENFASQNKWMENPEFRTYLTDMYGEAQFNALFNLIKETSELISGIAMVQLPRGNFTMGDDQSSYKDEKPAHSVTVDYDFEIGKYEVTQAQWQAVMGDNPSEFKSCGPNCPVEKVSWNDIQTFIQKLNQATQKHFRLPTEAEWEYACRAGTGNQYTYCGSNNIDQVAWYAENSNKITHPAGQKKANAWGLYDMSGNVWEWVQDGYHKSYNGAPNNASQAWDYGDMEESNIGNPLRVDRGGSWFNDAFSARSAIRSRSLASDRYSGIGFRLARTLP